MKSLKILTVLSLVLLMSACSTRMGQFTAVSSMNVRGLDYSIKNQSIARTEGDSCIHFITAFPIGDRDDRIQRAMDDAILNGRKRGLDGDLLVNARINHSSWSAFLYGRDCITVEGDLVSINTK